MKKRVKDQNKTGTEEKSSDDKKSGNKGSVQSGDNSRMSKRTANIHRQ